MILRQLGRAVRTAQTVEEVLTDQYRTTVRKLAPGGGQASLLAALSPELIGEGQSIFFPTFC